MASDEAKKAALVFLFELAAEQINDLSPEVDRQALFSKTLLGVEDAQVVEAWVSQNRELLVTLSTNEEWLETVWPLFVLIIRDKFFGGIEPAELPMNIAASWLRGSSYGELIHMAMLADASKPWGENTRRSLSESDVVDFLERVLGFDCPLILAAVSQFLFGLQRGIDERAAALNLFQKSLKYGLPDWLAITCFDAGFSDRFLALELRRALMSSGYEGISFVPALVSHVDVLSAVLGDFPKYYSAALQTSN